MDNLLSIVTFLPALTATVLRLTERRAASS